MLTVHVYRVSDREFDTHQCAKLEITYSMPTCAQEVIGMVNRIISTRLLSDVTEFEFLARRVHGAIFPPKTYVGECFPKAFFPNMSFE